MLLIARILILFFITMAAIRCPGCKKTFETNGGLSSHRRFCKTQINAFAKQILDQHQAVEEPHTKRPRFGKNRVVFGKGKEREEEPETAAVNESDIVRDMDVGESHENQQFNAPPVSSSLKFSDEFVLISIARTLTATPSIWASRACNTNATTLSR
jgi:hypothetical protein